MITCHELSELASSAVKVFNVDPGPDFARAIKLTLQESPIGNIIVKSSTGDADRLDELDFKALDAELEFFKETGKIKNLYFFVSGNELDPRHKKYQEFFKTYVTPSMYAWYTTENAIPEHDEISLKNRQIKKYFLSLNNRAAWFRQSLFYLFVKYELLDKSYFSYRMANRGSLSESKLFENCHQDIPWINEGLDFDDIRSLVPYTTKLESHAIHNMGDWGFGASQYYNDTFCSVITESYNEDPTFFTEKTFKAIKYQHPFLLYAGSNSFKTLQGMGFETFSDIFDEGYDTETHPMIRFEKMCREVLRISNLSMNELNSAFDHVMPVLEHNANHLRKTLPEIYKKEISVVVKDIKQIIDIKTKYLL